MQDIKNYLIESASQVRQRAQTSAALRQRVDLLAPNDRLLMELALSGATSRRRMGELIGVQAGTVTRRLQRLAARLHDPLVGKLLDPRCPLSPDHRQIGVEHFLTGLSARKLARKHGRSVAQVCDVLAYLRGWSRGIAAAAASAATSATSAPSAGGATRSAVHGAPSAGISVTTTASMRRATKRSAAGAVNTSSASGTGRVERERAR